MGNVLILNYHKIVEDEWVGEDKSMLTDKLTVKKSDFISQLDLIKSADIPVVSLKEWINGEHQNQLTAVLNFSGGHKSDIDIVLPTLTSKNLTATFFPNLSNVDVEGKTTWGDLKLLLDHDMDLGSQGVSNQNLRRVSKNACRLELELSKRLFENKTGKKIDYFSPPQGLYNRRLLQLAYNAGYQKVLVNRAKINTHNNSLLMHRFTVKTNTPISALEKLIVKGLLSHAPKPFFAKLSTQLSAEFGIGFLNKAYLKGGSHS
jgi:peptidoglycan/xylan/chitin deacetylase (PgdA/CDA1 family)